MARTYTKLIYHLVFSTKERIPLIASEIRDRLYEYLGGVIRGEKGSLMEIGGMPDHVHILARFGAAIAVSEMLKRIKGSSSHWLSQETGTWFAWQNGYGAFSVSESQVAAVRKYIQQQEEHHKRISFKDELISLLRKHRIEFDEGDLFD
ncbi:MAG TPA: IS200/IS605 family transposase [Thermoanaerobaculia bacterium]|nr:IS200/IS605 family transposase [Thermoanaerobaculia bacterium]